eukprot:TRINITY_DN44322_c0_g1_i1.p1 TRINITY_DN44322_c0_g1~~TRINITY_DN44322_c0_g1_i1.p1  ORF type:complete len:400 (+),score=65.83 TRINITY_DN44322_c0_g1_i1:90-1289(+)
MDSLVMRHLPSGGGGLPPLEPGDHIVAVRRRRVQRHGVVAEVVHGPDRGTGGAAVLVACCGAGARGSPARAGTWAIVPLAAFADGAAGVRHVAPRGPPTSSTAAVLQRAHWLCDLGRSAAAHCSGAAIGSMGSAAAVAAADAPLQGLDGEQAARWCKEGDARLLPPALRAVAPAAAPAPPQPPPRRARFRLRGTELFLRAEPQQGGQRAPALFLRHGGRRASVFECDAVRSSRCCSAGSGVTISSERDGSVLGVAVPIPIAPLSAACACAALSAAAAVSPPRTVAALFAGVAAGGFCATYLALWAIEAWWRGRLCPLRYRDALALLSPADARRALVCAAWVLRLDGRIEPAVGGGWQWQRAGDGAVVLAPATAADPLPGDVWDVLPAAPVEGGDAPRHC